jgi:hypothetical protein
VAGWRGPALGIEGGADLASGYFGYPYEYVGYGAYACMVLGLMATAAFTPAAVPHGSLQHVWVAIGWLSSRGKLAVQLARPH